MTGGAIIPFGDRTEPLVIFETARRGIAEATTVDQVNRILALATGLAAAVRKATDRQTRAAGDQS